MIRADEETLRCILLLHGNQAWERVMWWFRESFSREMDSLGGVDNDFRSGMVAQLHHFLKTVHEARPLLDATVKAKEFK